MTYLDATISRGGQCLRSLDYQLKWMKEEDLTIDKVIKPLNQKIVNKGIYYFEVDLEYPEKLYDSHNEHPLASEKMKVDNVEKLACSFYPKFHYVLHYRISDNTSISA